MSNENGNLPANSLHPAINPDGSSAGLTKREYFAALAMQGLLTNGHCDLLFPEQNAKRAINHADELLKQLEHNRG